MPSKLGGGSLMEAVSVDHNQLQSEHLVDFEERYFHCWVIVGWRHGCSVRIAKRRRGRGDHSCCRQWWQRWMKGAHGFWWIHSRKDVGLG